MKSTYLIILIGVTVTLLVSPFLIYYGNDIDVVTSESMAPTLEPFDLIAVRNSSISDVRVGDIIVFYAYIDNGTGKVVHRAIDVFNDGGVIGITTKGDNVDSADDWVVHSGDLIGKVVGRVPFVGLFLLDPIRYALSVGIVATAVLLSWDVRGKTKVLENQKKKKGGYVDSLIG